MASGNLQPLLDAFVDEIDDDLHQRENCHESRQRRDSSTCDRPVTNGDVNDSQHLSFSARRFVRVTWREMDCRFILLAVLVIWASLADVVTSAVDEHGHCEHHHPKDHEVWLLTFMTTTLKLHKYIFFIQLIGTPFF